MASTPSHKTSASASQTHLAPPAPGGARPRRMTTSSLPPPPSPLDLPEPVTYGRSRPPSPLRQAITADPDTGELSEDGSFVSDEGDHAWGERPPSPSSSSMAKIANNFAQRFGSFVNNMSARSSQQQLPTDEELEAEAERERERTRREAELIMSREAQARQLEERVLAMIDSDIRKTMTPPIPPSTPSPSSSPKEGPRWLSTVKNKLTPTKEPLTPAQQIIHETKVRDKEMEKEEKKLDKERKEAEKEMKKQLKKQAKQKSGEWPSSPEGKFSDPAFKQLAQPQPLQPPPPLRQMTSSPSSPSPMRNHSMPASLAPSPMRSNEGGSSSPARPGTPLYAQFNAQGALDVASTLLTIAGRFEKLERWTVTHVRALEERMDDVERWLVEKEKDKEGAMHSCAVVNTHRTGEPPNTDAAIAELRDELAEVQGRIGELGREMAKMVTSPANLSSGPSRPSTSINRAPSTSSSIAVRSMSSSMVQNSTPPRRQGSISPSVSTSPVSAATPSRTRLPYPTGDYTSPSSTGFLSQGALSPPSSPPQADASRRTSLSGLPPSDAFDFISSNGNSLSGLPSSMANSPPPLPPPPARAELRQASVSPTPRKRYTVALGGPIMSASRDQSVERPMTPHSRNQSRELGTAIFSSSPKSLSTSLDITDDDESDFGANEETIGKAAARNSGLAKDGTNSRSNGSSTPFDITMPPPTQPLKRSRARPQSMYSGFSPASNVVAPRPITPLNTKLRPSRSTEKFSTASTIADSASASSLPPITPVSGKFVDPYVVRRQTKEAEAINAAQSAPKVMPGKPKVPVGQLVAYFNKEKA
ncbi:hypothetical protein BDY19DRAFT_1088516 [Irpex rosettiformis]|uniref:Uncharacterized protein n=1 Tax=Irpex rosettiformis TaxID=378272 RepID=A0ACB8U590_9APHY|nr:hypothetical protein BDY19DRAFT_1088516 [Irpex rosettiformis]